MTEFESQEEDNEEMDDVLDNSYFNIQDENIEDEDDDPSTKESNDYFRRIADL